MRAIVIQDPRSDTWYKMDGLAKSLAESRKLNYFPHPFDQDASNLMGLQIFGTIFAVVITSIMTACCIMWLMWQYGDSIAWLSIWSLIMSAAAMQYVWDFSLTPNPRYNSDRIVADMSRIDHDRDVVLTYYSSVAPNGSITINGTKVIIAEVLDVEAVKKELAAQK